MYQIYQVGPNENIDIIAKKIGIPSIELRRINGIGDTSNIIAGSYIIIPSMNNMSMNTTDMTYMEDYNKYTVKTGDTMYGIAKNSNVDVDTLFTLNGLNKNDYIYPNQEIVIPNKKTYITKENDTIEDIINRLNIDIDKIKKLYVVTDQYIWR